MVSNNGTILDEFSESSEDLFPTEKDDDQNSVNLEDHNGSQDLSSAGEFSENIADPLAGSEELLNMSLSAALASETELMDITFRFFQDPNFLVYYRIHQILSFMNSVTTNLSTKINSFILFIFDNYVPQ